MQIAPHLLAAVPLLITGNLAFNPVLATHPAQLRQSSELTSHIEGSYRGSLLP